MRWTWRPGGHRRADHLPLPVRVASLRQDAEELGGRRDDPTLAAVLANEHRVVGGQVPIRRRPAGAGRRAKLVASAQLSVATPMTRDHKCIR